ERGVALTVGRPCPWLFLRGAAFYCAVGTSYCVGGIRPLVASRLRPAGDCRYFRKSSAACLPGAFRITTAPCRIGGYAPTGTATNLPACCMVLVMARVFEIKAQSALPD